MKCHKLSSTSSKDDRAKMHKVKMVKKTAMRRNLSSSHVGFYPIYTRLQKEAMIRANKEREEREASEVQGTDEAGSDN